MFNSCVAALASTPDIEVCAATPAPKKVAMALNDQDQLLAWAGRDGEGANYADEPATRPDGS